MNQRVESRLAQREPRYEFGGGQTVVVELKSEDGLDVREFSATLLDLSQSGARLTADECVPVEHEARLRFSIPDLGVVLYIAAQVCWTQQNEDGNWLLGCSLNPGLPDGFLTRLAAAGKVDRRSEDRISENVKTAASWNLDETWETVSLVNYSPGGFCVSGLGVASETQRCYLRLGQGNTKLVVMAQVQWRLEHDGTYLVGCSFLSAPDFERLQEFLQQQCITSCGSSAAEG